MSGVQGDTLQLDSVGVDQLDIDFSEDMQFDNDGDPTIGQKLHEVSEIEARVNLGFLEDLKKFSKRNTVLVAAALVDKSLAFGELREKTKLTQNQLNHTLIEMRQYHFVKLINGVYHLTIYGNIFLETMNSALKKTLARRKGLFNPKD